MRSDRVQVGQVLYRAYVAKSPSILPGDFAFEEYEVTRLTAQGFWYKARYFFSVERWVSFATRKVAATKEAAIVQLAARKHNNLWFARQKLRRAEREWLATHPGKSLPPQPLSERDYYDD